MTNQPRPLPPPSAYPAPPAVPRVEGLAVASLVLGIVWAYWIGSILAVIFGAIAVKRINESNGWRTGKGMAIAGLTLGIIGCVGLVVTIIVAAAVQA